jgi:hypothetical protein
MEKIIYYLVTKEELNQIKNDCVIPERFACEGCEYADDKDDTHASGLGCNFKGANALMDEVLSRPDPLEVLEKWRAKQNPIFNQDFVDLWYIHELRFIKELRTNPDEICRICDDCRKKHDSEIRNATLDAVERGIRNIPQTHFASVMDLIESLRTKEQQ